MNKKRFLIFFTLIMFFSLIIAVYQYVIEFQTEFANAVGARPAKGHSWSEMECDSAGLCVDSVNGRVGIGVSNPTKKLEVNGNIGLTGTITATTNVCIAGGACLSDLNGYVP